MSKHLRARFDHTDRAEIALRLLRESGIAPEHFSMRPSGGYEDTHNGYGVMPDEFAIVPFAPLMGPVGLAGIGNTGYGTGYADGAPGGFFPAAVGLYEHSNEETAYTTGGEVELLLTVSDEKLEQARALLRSAHGRQIH